MNSNSSNQTSRRRVLQGAAWSAPAITLSTAAPAFAASTPATPPPPTQTATVTPQFWRTIFTRTPTSCNTTTNPQMGYVDSLACGSPTTPSNSDCLQSPNTSDGYWFESSAPGTVTTNSISTTYTFSKPVKLDECPVSGTANTSGTSKWTSCNIYNGWSIAQTSPTTIVATYSAVQTVDASTSVNGTGWATGYFFNFHMTGGCYATGGQTVATSTTWNYTTATGAKTWTKTSPATGI